MPTRVANLAIDVFTDKEHHPGDRYIAECQLYGGVTLSRGDKLTVEAEPVKPPEKELRIVKAWLVYEIDKSE